MAASATQTNFPELFEPLQAGELKLKNRIILAPMTRARSQGRVPNSANVEYYRQRAGAGLLITEATTISEVANGWADSPGIYTEEQAEGWKKVVDAVHEEGSQIICQLWHIGRASHSSFMPEGESIVSASAIAIEGEGVYGADIKKHPHEVPRALETEEVEATVEDYGKAAEFAKAAGFDGVEIHGANGYLIDQFLQSCSNVREDKYGGDVEGRFTFCKEIIERVLQVYPAGRVGIRLSPNGAYNGMGAEDNFESFLKIFSMVDQLGPLGYVHMMDGLGFGFHEKCKAMELKDVRPLISGTLFGNVGYTPDSAAEAIKRGDVDAIAFGRPYISNPDFAARVANGWPLAELAPVDTWFKPTDAIRADPNLGYTDWPVYAPSSEAS